MNDQEASKVLESMVQFIENHGRERADTIRKQAMQEFTIEKEKYIASEKERVIGEYKNKLQQDEIRLRIQRSAEQNQARIQKMQFVNELVQKLYKEAQTKMVEDMKRDTVKYKELLKDLILQGLIKLIEPEVMIKCRKSDEAIVKQVMDAAANDYKSMMANEVLAFKGKDVPLKLVLDEQRRLPEFSGAAGTDSCMGGIVMHAKKGRIVCSNTLDERLLLCYEEAIPDIRRILFPSFKKAA